MQKLILENDPFYFKKLVREQLEKPGWHIVPGSSVFATVVVPPDPGPFPTWMTAYVAVLEGPDGSDPSPAEVPDAPKEERAVRAAPKKARFQKARKSR